MINLLPHDYKLGLHYGRLNIRLGQWLGISLIIVAGLVLILGLGWLYMDQQIKSLNRSIATTQEQLKTQKLEEVRKQADEISQNIRVINQVLGREIRFSSLIQEIGKVMPTGTVLNSLTLSEKVNGAVDLNASTKNSTAAAQIAINLSDPKNNLFTKVDIVNVNCSSVEKTYPCTASLRALFDKKTFERFLNVAAGEAQ
jgi:Tfp pilus assembly protein PilN